MQQINARLGVMYEFLGHLNQGVPDTRSKRFWTQFNRQKWRYVAMDVRPLSGLVLVQPLRNKSGDEAREPEWVNIMAHKGSHIGTLYVMVNVPAHKQPDCRYEADGMPLRDMLGDYKE